MNAVLLNNTRGRFGELDFRSIGRAAGLVACALVYGGAAIAKLFSFAQLTGMINASGLLTYHPDAVRIVAIAVLLAEAGTALALIVPVSRIAGLWSACFLSLFYMAFAIWRHLNNIQAPCSCYGPLFKMSPLESFALCLLTLIIASATIVSYGSRSGWQQATQ